MPARNLLLQASLVAAATLAVRAQDATTQPRTPMPETKTQTPAPVVRRAPGASVPQQIVPNADGSLPHSVHAGEYRDSYPAGHPPKPKAAPSSSTIPTINPLTSLGSQTLPVVPKPPAPLKPLGVAKVPAVTAAHVPTSVPAVPKPKVTTPAPETAATSKPAQANTPAAQLPPGPFNRNVVVIDPAHGGADVGSRITDSLLEKDVDLQFAFKLRSLLTARGFTVVLTRETDTDTLQDKPDSPLTLDARAGLANRQQAAACLLIHATGSGHGAHLYTSELTAVPAEPYAAPWLSAQDGWVSQSVLLQKQLGRALTRAGIPLVFSRASVRPVDSLTCPALVIELAPDTNEPGSINNDGYQQRVANAVATALIFWQNNAQPPARLAPPAYKPPVVAVKPEASATPPVSTPAPVVQP